MHNQIIKIGGLILSTHQNFLVVDDDFDMVQTVFNHIRKMGFNGAIHETDSVDRAKELLEDHKIDYIICDYKLKGEDGVELVKYARSLEAFKDIPFLMISQYNDVDHMQESSKNGSSDYLTKPFTINQLGKKMVDGWKTHALHLEDVNALKFKIKKLEEEIQVLKGNLPPTRTNHNKQIDSEKKINIDSL